MTGLPGGWVGAPLGDVVELVRGVSYDKATTRSEPAPGFVPVLRATNVGVELSFTELVYVPSRFVSSVQYLRPGDSVLVASSGSRSVVGRAALLNKPWQGAFGAFLMVVRPRPRMLPALLGYFLQSPLYREGIARLAAGVNINNLKHQHVAEFPLLIPPLDEQRRIVAAIEEHLGRLDAAVAGLKRVQTLIPRYRAAVLKAAVEGKLVEPEAPLARKEKREYESGEKLLARIRAERAILGAKPQRRRGRGGAVESESNDSLAPPEGWAGAKWNDVGLSQNGRSFPSAEYAHEGVKLLRPGNLHVSGEVRWTEDNTRRLPARWAQLFPAYLVGENELVMNLTAQSLKDEFLGRACMTGAGERCLLNQRIARLTPTLLDRRYVLWVFKSTLFRRFVDGLNSGSLIQHMFTSQLSEFELPIPPLVEQERIAGEIERRLSLTEAVERELQAGLARASRLRQSILKRAFEGKLVPQDPNDEPGSVLLERIRAERAAKSDGSAKVLTTPNKRRRATRAESGQER